MNQKYDTFWQRFFAGLIDGIVLIPVSLLVALIKPDSVFGLILGMVVTYGSYFIYSVYFHWKTGQTIGKKLLDIRVVDKGEGRLISLRQSFMRDSVYMALQSLGVIFLSYKVIQLGYMPDEKGFIFTFLDLLGFIWFLLEVITMMTNDKRRAFHDLLAESVVIKEEYWKKGIVASQTE